MKKTICLLPGDGIGPEILAEGVKVLKAAAEKFGHEFVFDTAHIGGSAIDAAGDPLPEETVRKCRSADAVTRQEADGLFHKISLNSILSVDAHFLIIIRLPALFYMKIFALGQGK